MTEEEKRIEIAVLEKGLEDLKGIIPDKQWSEHEKEVKRKIEKLG
ncbi:hypothetical protein [Clostridium sp.]|nr:hypothetical protein [Clostridium sp.]